MKTFRFLEFKVYQDAKTFHVHIFDLAKRLKQTNYYCLSDQILRSSLSDVLNIAGGSANNADRGFGRFVKIALGSTSETVAGLDVCLAQKLITKIEF